MKRIILALVLLLSCAGLAPAAEKPLLLDDFQGVISGGPEGTVDFGSGNGSTLEVSAASDIKKFGKQSLKANYNAVAGGYIYIAKGFGLDAKNAGWLVKPLDIDWKNYSALAFYLYGSDSKAKIAVDLKDSGNEMWRFIITDNFLGWRQIVCSLKDFYIRGDWQPQSADKNRILDFPLQSYQFELLPEAKGVFYFEQVELIK
ncbi:MAG: carbohydrate binding domain-containing protein [Candidatus Omnitrophota bacterium]